MIDDSRPENLSLGSTVIVESSCCFDDVGLPLANFGGALGGAIEGPDREVFLRLSVLGVANREILKGVALGVALNIDPFFSPLEGDPASVTLVGEFTGRLAGD